MGSVEGVGPHLVLDGLGDLDVRRRRGYLDLGTVCSRNGEEAFLGVGPGEGAAELVRAEVEVEL